MPDKSSHKVSVLGWLMLAAIFAWGIWIASFATGGIPPPYFDAGFFGWIGAMSILVSIWLARQRPPPGSKGALAHATLTRSQRWGQAAVSFLILEAVLFGMALLVTFLFGLFVQMRPH
jgi:hypothetical protein